MKRPSCLSALLSLTVAVGVPAISAELDIPGNYGNEAGCRHAATGDFEGDDLLLLTRRDVSTYATLCSFVHLYPAEADSHVAVVTCGHEGEGYTTLGLMRVQKDPDGVDAYHIFDEDGATWGKAGRCP
ncbi:hypothetical protein [Mesorhizobium sp. YM1C-6-2]|uniref:hypothetical protein n=1 Tax=Mesorhizobium sp. YM1C-6-2 TaxID=1827501 RepID=UPI0011C49223|nr:hypothetical protein [Mesorhizobium sp. YM1C-6-2]